MGKWKPVGGETWRRRKRERRVPMSGGVWWFRGPAYKTSPTDPLTDPGPEWERVGWTEDGPKFVDHAARLAQDLRDTGAKVTEFGPGALHDTVIVEFGAKFWGNPQTGKGVYASAESIEARLAEHVATPQTCTRCGHRSGGCPKCGRSDPILGGRIDGQYYCNLQSPRSCYSRTIWERANPSQ